ncbi:hypothetical protein [Brevundimonas sp. Leaf363]|uniref:hypothetical protein n=1 Tax=Brevundimonas sp. Leaf363 TaxID=1736353 RepID=UPI000A5852BF|nr:hypothetical protein [Brevundimonas sp. Leaf363]
MSESIETIGEAASEGRVAYGPAALDADAMDVVRRQRRRDRDTPPAWWLHARRETRSFK